ncbi:hypothetical protein [Paenibacillus sp. RC67]|uniref:hypothetical protein n=1 Tax=Paenibacillus sp. RC67 TaxID=3039392 RepID=UPI0024AE012B|nr:hypothetical protein [Paenibacillus sp. RC67]
MKIFKRGKRKMKYAELRRELLFYKPIYEFVMADVYWVNLNWRLLRFLVGQFEKEYEAKGLSKDEVVQLDSSTTAYISSLLTFFERKIQKLQIYFDRFNNSTLVIKPAANFFYGHFDLILRVQKDIKSEVDKEHISLSKLRYLYNYIFSIYLDTVEGIKRFEVVSKELEHFS